MTFNLDSRAFSRNEMGLFERVFMNVFYGIDEHMTWIFTNEVEHYTNADNKQDLIDVHNVTSN